MEAETSSWKIGSKITNFKDEKLKVRLVRDGPGRRIELQPATGDEPLFRTFRANRLSCRSGRARAYATAGDVVVTANRVLLLFRRGPTGKGAENYTIFSIRRSQLSTPSVATDRRGRVKSIELATAGGETIISLPSLKEPAEKLLEMLKPESARRLGPEAAAERNKVAVAEAERRQAAERKAAAEKAELAKARFAGVGRDAPPKRAIVQVPTGALMDHRRTWHYRVGAPPEGCVAAFHEAFSGGGGLLARAKWDIKAAPKGAVTVYRGRKGIVGFTTLMSKTATAEQEGALGSEVRFEIVAEEEGFTICALWLSLRGSKLVFTNDARFFRPYMRSVETALRRVDPTVQVVKE
jgi:hypothetical protein